MIFLIIGIFCFLSVGYATFGSNFLIAGKGTIVTKTVADELSTKAVTSGDGLYADTYERGRYVYRGSNVDNYITFNGEDAGWRIISAEADGTLKIIRNQEIGYKKFDSEGARDSNSNGAGGTYCADTLGCNAWGISDNYVNGSLSGTVLKDAELNTYLNTNYYGTISMADKIKEHDFYVGGVVDDDSADLASQINDEKSIIWKGKIGLISLSDIINSNIDVTNCGNFYLHSSNQNCRETTWVSQLLKNIGDVMWTITPKKNNYSVWSYHYDAMHIIVYENTNNGVIDEVNFDFDAYEIGVYPVVYLKEDIVLSGEGTDDEPYVIE